MIHVSFVIKTSHLNLLQFKYLITINFLLCSYITNIIDTPMCSIAYVQKGYVVSALLTYCINYEYRQIALLTYLQDV